MVSQFQNENLQYYLTNWVKLGGKLIMQGESIITKIYQNWFNKNWRVKLVK